MDYDTTPPFAPEPPSLQPEASGPRWPRRVGAVAGIAALSAAAIGFGTAAAQTDDASDGSFEESAVIVQSGVVGVGPLGDGEMTAFDECLADALPDDGFSVEALPVVPPAEGDEGPLPPPGNLEELDAQFDAALEGCEELLSDEDRAEMARWEDFDQCIDAQFEELGPMVTIDGEDGLTLGSFGDEAGTITVTKAADGSISVDTSGSATVSDDPAGEDDWFLPGAGECAHPAPEDLDA